MISRFPSSPALLAALLLASAAPAQQAASVAGTAPALQATAEDPVEALGRYLRVLAAFPNNLDALSGAGRSALAIGDANAAISFFSRAEKIAPQDGRIKAGLASALVQVEQPATALRLFDQAVALGVPETQVASDRGLAHDLVGETKRAQQDYQLSLRARPDDETTRRLAVSQAIAGDRAGAMTTLDPLLRRQDRAAWRVRAFAFALTGDTRAAEEAALQLMPRPQAQAMSPFFNRLATLNPAQKAAAVNLGQLPSDGRSNSGNAALFARADVAVQPPAAVGQRADASLIPSGAPFGATPAGLETRRREQGRIALAARAPLPATSPPPRYETVTGTAPGTASQIERPGFSTRTETVTLTRQDTQDLPAAAPYRQYPAAALPAPAATTTPASVPAATASLPTSYPSAARPLAPSATATTVPVPTSYPPVATRPATTAPTSLAPATGSTGAATDLSVDRLAQPSAAATAATVAAAPSGTAPTASTSGPLATGAPIQAVALPPSGVAGQGFVPSPTSTPTLAPAAAAEPAQTALAAVEPARTPPPTEAPRTTTRADTVAPRTAIPPARTARVGEKLAAIAEDRPARATRAAADAKAAKDTADKTAGKDVKDAKDTRDAKNKAADAKKQLAAKDDKASKGTDEGKGRAGAKDAKDAKDGKDAKNSKETKSASAKGKADDKAAKQAAKADDDGDDKSKGKGGERYWVQVASGSNKADLGRAWERTKAKAPQLLSGRPVWTAPWKQSNRVMVGPFKSEEEAQSFVNQLGKSGTGAMQITTRAGAKVERLGVK